MSLPEGPRSIQRPRSPLAWATGTSGTSRPGSLVSSVVPLSTVAFLVERRASRGRLGWLRSPLVYTLSLSIYCTAWTFYGAVGYAARSGLEFLTIYFGPTLVFVGWWWLLRKLVRIGRQHHVTSLADLISSRYGKSNTLGVIVTLTIVSLVRRGNRGMGWIIWAGIFSLIGVILYNLAKPRNSSWGSGGGGWSGGSFGGGFSGGGGASGSW